MAEPTIITPETVPEPEFAEDAKKRTDWDTYTPSDEKGSALHEQETEREALKRVYDRIWGVMVPEKRPYDMECREIEEAYEGIVREAKTNQESKVFPLVFMLTDAKLASVLAHRPKAVFEIDYERKKIPLIEHAYNHFTTDVDDGVNLEAVDHIWHWYNELYGWSIKRVWHEVDTEIGYEPKPKTDDKGDMVYGKDGFVELEYCRKIKRKGRIKQRVYDYDQVAVDPVAKFLYQADDIVFFEDIHYNQFVQQYKYNPTFKNTQCVRPGAYHDHRVLDTTKGVDSDGNSATVFAGAANLRGNFVRIEEYYCRSRCEYMLKANNIPILHIPNPTPDNWLPAADLHNRLRPKCFYDKGEGKLQEPMISVYQKLLNSKTRRAQLAASPVVLTDNASSLTPKSFKVYPGAHWKGLKGRVEVLDLSGQDSGEVTEYLAEMRNLMKTVSGNDFERLIADPDPTAQQQAARDAASRIRPEKDIKLQENIGHVRAVTLVVRNIQTYMTIPELADIKDLSQEELKDIQKEDRIGKDKFYKYPRIRTTGVRFIEQYDKAKKSYNLMPDRKNSGDGHMFTRPEFLQTKNPVRVRVVSNRQETMNKQIKFEMYTQLLQNAFSLPAKNQSKIDMAMASGKPAPEPEFFINREEAVEGYIASIGADVEEMTARKDDPTKRKAQEAIKQLMKTIKPITPDPSQLPAQSVPNQQPHEIPDLLPQGV